MTIDLKRWQRIRVVFQHPLHPPDSIRHRHKAPSTTSFKTQLQRECPAKRLDRFQQKLLWRSLLMSSTKRNSESLPESTGTSIRTSTPSDCIFEDSVLKDPSFTRHPRRPRGGGPPTYVQQTSVYLRQPSASFRHVPNAWSTPI